MGPYPFALAAALVSGLLAGVALGTIRLTRLSLAWWRRVREHFRRRARVAAGVPGSPGAADAADEPEAPGEPHGPPGAFPRAHGAIALAAGAAVFLLLIALALEPGPARTPAAEPPGAWGLAGGLPGGLMGAFGKGGALGLLGFGLSALLASLVWAVVAAALDRGVHGLSLHVARRAGSEDLEFSFADLRESALSLWDARERRGEPFGVGLGYVALFASPVAAFALVLVAPEGRLDVAGLVAFGAAFLVVPLAYAAAAERSPRDAVGRLRRRAALRQLLAAPAWLLALASGAAGFAARATGAAGPAAAAFGLALALPFALPGASPAAALVSVHRGGDQPETSPALRTITGLAHHAWMGAWAALVGGLVAPHGASLALRVAVALAALAALVLVRALLALALSTAMQRWALVAAVPLGLFALVARGGLLAGLPWSTWLAR